MQDINIKSVSDRIEKLNMSYLGKVALFKEFGIALNAAPDTQNVEIAIGLRQIQENQQLVEFHEFLNSITPESSSDTYSNEQIKQLISSFQKIAESADQTTSSKGSKLYESLISFEEKLKRVESMAMRWGFTAVGIFGSYIVALLLSGKELFISINIVVSIAFGFLILIFTAIAFISYSLKIDEICKQIKKLKNDIEQEKG